MHNQNELPPPGGHYSAAMRAGDFVFTAGQTPRDLDRRVVGTDIETQTVTTIQNLEAALKSVGADLDQVVKVTVHLSTLSDFKAFDVVYARYFTKSKPVRTTVGSELNGVLVEIDAVAFVG
ncbi:RidA family protein [Methylobacterium sp. WL64]|uniref:RidA family protein n=1 Tax=Methylobacterium sp. WL64 TaxID=2603894 RepID=UPI0011CBDC10|nr:RidA family protein [Methylobacterium sp. WL64]TXM97141.1 RidA family protein [Methylobacterium sp. WL64]